MDALQKLEQFLRDNPSVSLNAAFDLAAFFVNIGARAAPERPDSMQRFMKVMQQKLLSSHLEGTRH